MPKRKITLDEASLEMERAEHLLKGALCSCSHTLNEHAEAYDDYDTRFCSECECEFYNGDIGEAFDLYAKEKNNP